MPKYQFVSHTSHRTLDSIAEAKRLGLIVTGYNKSTRCREELQDRPQFQGFLGPMWGGIDEKTGTPIIRYETQKAYDMYSN